MNMREHIDVRVGDRNVSDVKLQSMRFSCRKVQNIRQMWRALKEALHNAPHALQVPHVCGDTVAWRGLCDNFEPSEEDNIYLWNRCSESVLKSDEDPMLFLGRLD